MTVSAPANDFHWVRDPGALEAMVSALNGADFVAIDTEFRRRDTFFPEVALLQLAAEGNCWLVDPLSLNDTGPLIELLTDDARVKVLHSGSEDLEVFEHWLGVLPKPLVDTQKAAAMLGLGFGLGYRDLVQELLGVQLAKDETQSDWLQRPLTPAQCEYACQDVTFLAGCWPLLEQRARQRDILPWIFEEASLMTSGGRGPLAKFRSAWKLAGPELSVLLALIDWREAEARRRDKPRNWVLHDKVIQELVRTMPSSMPELARVAGIPSGVVRRDGKGLLACIAEARTDGAENPPSRLPPPASPAVKRLAKSLVPALADIADRLGMNQEILMPSRDLEAIARSVTDSPDPTPVHWQGWRAETVVTPLLDEARRLHGAQCHAG